MQFRGDGVDVLIAGAGAGGATIGYALARAGRSVLFVEQGRNLSTAEPLRGVWAEATTQYRLASGDQRQQVLIDCGRNPESFEDGVCGRPLTPMIGYGTGGSSSLYGMVLERRYPHDFETWPIAYEDLAPWYAQAESLYEVRGSTDPLRVYEPGCPEPLMSLSLANESMFAHLRRIGLHPYRLHLASRRIPDCRMCQGYLCAAKGRCKNDARVTCLEPALDTGNAKLIANARLVRLESINRRVTAAVVQVNNEQIRLTAKLYVLAAGALSTPRILLVSGLANSSGLLGRRLMRHAIDLFVLTFGPRHDRPIDSKELALNDYYAKPSEHLGTVQSFGIGPALEYLRNKPGSNIWKMLGRTVVPIKRLFGNAPIIAGILDDRPLPENRVDVCRTGGRLMYRLMPPDIARRGRLRRQIVRAFARYGPVPVFASSDSEALGHVCGTAVFGDNPASSVLNAQNRVHEVDNLYVVDASFFPTSGGVNPALTIVANALRVAHHIHQEVL